MSAENFLRTETVHIDEASGSGTSTIQWFAENRNKKGSATHPISHNNKLTFHICGEEGFAAIAKDIALARESIDLVCWGFDPGMELVRQGCVWPRGATYGDLLIDAGRRGVQVRLLVWYSYSGGSMQKNMPGYTHGTSPWRTRTSDVEVQQISSRTSMDLIRDHAHENRHKREWNIMGDKLAEKAREEYCHSWYKAAFAGKLNGIKVLTRDGNGGSISNSLAHEARQPDVVERKLFTLGGTHHQKPVLIDFAYNNGEKAVGYVMGLNSQTDYWDTPKHTVESQLREQGGTKTVKEQAQGVDQAFNFETLKPYRDYACRIEGGRALIPLHENFERAWQRAEGNAQANAFACISPPSTLLRKAISGDSTAQIVRTQPDENDFTIKEVYFNATRIAAAATGYLYMENQYFQYQDWSDYLMAVRTKVIAGWNKNCGKIGKGCEDMPMLHVFVVIPTPEQPGMVPRTYDTLAVLGKQDGMTGQDRMIKGANALDSGINGNYIPSSAADAAAFAQQSTLDVVVTANRIEKPTAQDLEKKRGLRVCVAVLNACEFSQDRRQWRYREIYIHSKLLVVDDSFLTLGSANLNQRSMAVDSEINVATNDSRHVTALRRRIWAQLAGIENDGGECTPEDIKQTFNKWEKLMKMNKARQKSASANPTQKQMIGLIVPLDDGRSSTVRVA